MAGGNWTTQNKVRPGAYVNVNSNGMNVSVESIRGTVTMPWVGDFGKVGEILEVTSRTNFLREFGYNLNAPEMILIREVLKRASRLLLYRVNGGDIAQRTINDLTVTAKHPGVRGDDLKIRILDHTEGYFIVETLLDADVVDTQQARLISELKANDWVIFSGNGNLSPTSTAGFELTGGASAEANRGDYVKYFEALAAYDFNVMAFPVEEQIIKELAATEIIRLRKEEGKKSQLVVSGYEDRGHEAIINVRNGVIFRNQIEVDEGKTEEQTLQAAVSSAVAWVAGATAGANVNESNTFTTYEGAIDVLPRLSNEETIAALRAGEFVFTEKRGRVVVEQDINSLTVFTAEKSEVFSKNRTMRVLDDISSTVKMLFEDVFIGRVSNNEDGRTLFRSEVINYMNGLQQMGAVENFTADDVIIKPGMHKDSIVVDLNVQPTDAMEKLYMQVIVE